MGSIRFGFEGFWFRERDLWISGLRCRVHGIEFTFWFLGVGCRMFEL
jgi:hypothetical protein